MKTLRIPVLADLEFVPAVLELSESQHADCRLRLVQLWSFSAQHGPGPHHPLAVAKACDATHSFVAALARCGWIDLDGDAVTIRRWEDVLEYVEPAPVVGDGETKADRRRRQVREAARRFRQRKKQRELDAQSPA